MMRRRIRRRGGDTMGASGSDPAVAAGSDPAVAAGGAPVVAGVSGTAASLAAVRVAAAEAARRRRPLRLVHAFSWTAHPAGTAPSYPAQRGAADEMLERAAGVARHTAPDVPVTGRVLDGSASRVLLQQSRAAHLLVVGDDDPAATVCLPVESVLLQLVARARCPVLVARDGGTPGGPVVVGVDGSPSSLLALRYAAETAAARAVALDVVHVWQPHAGERESTARTLVSTAVAAMASDRPARTWVVPGEPADVLVQRGREASLLVLGPRGAGGGFWTLVGSVGQAVLGHCSCPVAFVHGATGTAVDLLDGAQNRTATGPS